MPDKKPFNQNPAFVKRNHEIWKARVDGLSLAQIGEIFNLSEQRVHQVIKQVVAAMPADERDTIEKLRRSYLDRVRQRAMEVVELAPKKRYAANGRQIEGDDYSEILAGIDRVLKVDERIARLTGTDNAIAHTVAVTAEAEQATKDAADDLLKHFPSLAGVVPAGSG